MGDIKDEFRGNNSWDISGIILEEINWEDISSMALGDSICESFQEWFRGNKLSEISSIALGDVICGTFEAWF